MQHAACDRVGRTAWMSSASASASSSTSSSSTRQHVRRNATKVVEEEEFEDNDDAVRPKIFIADSDDLSVVVINKMTVEEIQEKKWSNLTVDSQTLCVKTVVRLLLMKGARKEGLNRTHLSDTLGKLDANYKKHIDAILLESQKVLEGVFGYSVVSARSGAKDELFVLNIIQSSQLLATLSEIADEDAAFTGFCYVIFQIIFTSPGRYSDAQTILQKLRKVDSRFPETLLAKASSVAASKRSNPVPELHDDFLGLMGRMRKRSYVTVTKAAADPGKVEYGLGPRFALDLGKRRLIRAYFTTMGQSMDQVILNQLIEEDAKAEAEQEDEDEGA